MLDTVYSETQEKMARAIDALKADLLKVRTGRASANMLDAVRVDYYGTLTPLHQMASISTPESRLLVIQPWDATAMKEIEKGILKANVGLTPSNDGKVIRISIPPLTEERRKDIVKQVGKTCEEYKVGVRNLRRDANETLKAFKKDGDISEDEMFKGQDQIQKLTDDHIRQVEDLQKAKEKEVLEF
ncbi:ribosome recycling factor [Desulfobotulus alkaliphilus]|uniref:Ribosome-recycling factor n=1 Tax=Desulfobotulus alkaliphilus TaxID=622671 RepID=A0A562SA61_9BACT|nr:ribosome recycling factor [Desulfobotulus alkaliphilus]TWI77426.1 ribosome recycling factor [Desulfobotulus alkaliphilus]